jgi:amino-acid N-acetyltransferase
MLAGAMANRTLPTVILRRARPEDLGAVERLLRDAELPLAGVAEHLGGFRVAVSAGGVVGAVGIERYDPFGLLRSAVVERESRGRGLGTLLTTRALEDARTLGLRAVYLLTTTAADYFTRFGFRRIPRAEVAPELWKSAELQGACPETAILMVLDLAASPGME